MISGKNRRHRYLITIYLSCDSRLENPDELLRRVQKTIEFHGGTNSTTQLDPAPATQHKKLPTTNNTTIINHELTMSTNRRDYNDLPFPFNNEYYADAQGLVRGSDGLLHDPSHRETNGQRQQRVNNRWEENVRRVMGEEFVDRWPDLQTMISHYTDRYPPVLQTLDRAQLEKAGRLKAWSVHPSIIHVIVGWPSQGLSKDKRDVIDACCEDERLLLRHN